MTKLEDFLDKYTNKELEDTIYNKYKYFDYDDEDMFQLDLEFLLNNIYNIKIIESKQKRMGQQEFRHNVLEMYGGQCIISKNNCDAELEACHIVPVAIEEDYSLNNSLLLERNIHSTFDKYLWSINPDTFMIEVKDGCGSIKKYEGKTLNLNDNLKSNLYQHYKLFLELKK
jgi:predicted restriction endonuclease